MEADGRHLGAEPKAELRVRQVRTSAESRRFCNLPYRLYRDDPMWVAPLRAFEAARWSSTKNAALRNRWVRRFLAYRGSEIVGRVAAIHDPVFSSKWEPATGSFGFFECAHDALAARALLRAAEDALKERSCRAVLGPIQLTTHDEVGALVQGFDEPPMLLSPYNPPYYPTLFESAGYSACHEHHAYRWRAEDPGSALVERAMRSVRSRANVRMRSSSRETWDEDRRLVFDLYNECFHDLWGFVPLCPDEFDERASSFQPFYRPELCVFAEVDGRPAAFGLVLPDVHEALRPLRGRLLPFGWIRLKRGFARIRRARMILLGVLPQFRGRALGVSLGYELRSAVRRLGFEGGEISLIQEGNRRVRRLVESFGYPRVKTYRLFRRVLGQ